MSFAEKVGRRTFAYCKDKDSGIAQLETSDPPRHSVIRFNGDAPAQAHAILSDAGFTKQDNGDYTRPIEFDTRMQDRLIAERAYSDVCRLAKESPNRGCGRG